MRINISIFTPHHLRRSGPWGELILLSRDFPVIPDDLDEKRLESLMEAHGTRWAAVLVRREGNYLRAYLWRSLISSPDIYYTLQNATLFVSDLFVGCAAHVPKQARHPSTEAIIDHFLFRTVYGENTYFEKVHRVGHGMCVMVDLGSALVEKRQFAIYSPHPRFQPEERYLELVDSALEESLAEFRADESVLLFSGGVDSTLLATYLPRNPLVTNTITSPEFAADLSCAQQAAALLDKDIHVNVLDEADFLQRFEEIVDNIWMPPFHAQTIIFSSAFKSHHGKFITGQSADAVFGLFRHQDAYYGPILAKPVIREILGLLAVLPIPKLTAMWSVAQSFHACPTASESFALKYGCRTTIPSVERFFSRRDIDRRLVARYEYVTRFLDFESEKPERSAHLEIGQQIDFFCDDTVSVWKQLASSYGKTLYAPFSDPHVYAAAMSIPASMRYMDRRTEKHILRKLLARRLPVYPSAKPKLALRLPIQRFAANGPLRNCLDRYPPPDFIDADTLKIMQTSKFSALWSTILFSVWNGRIANLNSTRTPDLSVDIEAGYPASLSENVSRDSQDG